jgi:hypothetical protein
MSYLNIPRLHFTGKFLADPSTVDNNDANWDPNIPLSNDQSAEGYVYWNPTGTHNFKFLDCTVRGAANDQGMFTAPSNDPIIGARVLCSSPYPAKLVDLDPDNQNVSQIWGMELQVNIADPTDPAKTLASVTGTLSTFVNGQPLAAVAFGDLWNRSANIPPAQAGMETMCAAFHGLLVLSNTAWVNAAASPLLAALQAVSPNTLSIRFNVDSYQSDNTQSNFTYGRVVGTIGPVLAGDAPRSTPRRLAPVGFSTDAPPIFSSYGPAGAAWDAQRSVLILDLGNCIPTVATLPPSGTGPVPVPDAGWPIPTATLQLTIPGPSVNPNASHTNLKSRTAFRATSGAPTVVGGSPFQFSLEITYLTYAGVIEISVSPSIVGLLNQQPLTLTDITNSESPVVAVQEDALGRYVDVDVPFFRFNPNDTAPVTLWATQFGQPWSGAVLPVQLQAAAYASNGNPFGQKPPPPDVTWNNSDPQGALTLSANTLTTNSYGTATLQLTASDPGTPRTYPDGQPGPDGQVYWITGPWAAWGQIFLFPGAPINVLIFSSYLMPLQPNWDDHVGPILSTYARLYPYMKGIIDLSDYPTVVENAGAIQHVLNLPVDDPHHMPIVRDLSRDKLAMINQWFANGRPQSASVPINRG